MNDVNNMKHTTFACEKAQQLPVAVYEQAFMIVVVYAQ